MITKLIRRARFNCIQLLRIKKSDHLIAMGFTAGLLHCWFPTFGIGMLLSIGLARLLRANIAASIIAGSLGSFLWPILFFMNYKAGYVLTSLFSTSTLALSEALPDEPDYSEAVDHLNSLGQLGTNFIVGSLFNSVVFSIVCYFIILFLLKRYRTPLLRRLKRS